MDFTNEEKERINQLYGNDFAGITPEDALLIGRWEAWKATEDAKFKAEMEEIKRQTDAKIANLQMQSDEAMNNLKELHAKALERFERISENVEEK